MGSIPGELAIPQCGIVGRVRWLLSSITILPLSIQKLQILTWRQYLSVLSACLSGFFFSRRALFRALNARFD
jgi:hypothetical protein